MKLGENILKLRKESKLSQEQLAEKVNVTRQTISNWELGETSPNPEQLILLSKVLNVSVDELLGNEIKSIIEQKVSNTEKLAGLIIKILKVIGVLFIIFLVIDVASLIIFGTIKHTSIEKINNNVELECKLNDKTYNYLIEADNDDNIVDASGSEFITNIVKDKEFAKGKMLVKYIESYFKDNGGSC